MALQIDYKPFYSVLARYLLEERLVDRIKFDDSHLVVREITGKDYEFVIDVRACGEDC